MSHTADTLHRLYPLAAPSAPATPPPAPQAPPAPLALARRVLARRPEALRDLEDALAAWQAGGETALAAYLDRPVTDVSLDPLATMERVQRAMELELARLPSDQPSTPGQRRMLSAILVTVAKATEAIRQGRPEPPEEDEAEKKIQERREAAIERMLGYTRAEAKDLAARREALEAWATSMLGPMIASELKRRVDAMLDGEDEAPDGPQPS